MFRQLFTIYPGEGKRTTLFVLLSFAWSFAIFCGLCLGEALFILHVGASSLPAAYLMTSCGMLVVSGLVVYGTHRLNAKQMLLAVFSTLSLYYLLVWSGVVFWHPPPLSFWFGVKVLSYMSFLIANTAFWNFTDHYHDLQDGKRTYALYNAITFLGQGAAGVIIGADLLSLRWLLVTILIALGATLFLALRIDRKLPAIYDDTVDEKSSSGVSSLLGLLPRIARSKFTLLLLINWLLLQVLNSVTDYSVLSSFEWHLSQEAGWQTEEVASANLTLFMGRCLAVTSIGALLFGLFGYGRIIRRYGLNNAVPLLPLLYISIYSAWTVSDSLIMAIFGFFLLEGLIDTFDDNNYNLLINAVPARLRRQVRALIDSFVEPTGMLIGALILSSFSELNHEIGLTLALVTLTFALLLRSSYLPAIFANLQESTLHFGRSPAEWFSTMRNKERVSALKTLVRYRESVNQEEREMAQMMLAQITSGEESEPKDELDSEELFLQLRDRSLPYHERLQAARNLAQVAPSQLQEGVDETLLIEIEHAAFLLVHGEEEYEEPMLRDTLISGYRATVDFSIQLLGVSHAIEQAEVLVHALHSRNSKSASHAIEMLEKSCAPRLFLPLAPLIDLDIPHATKLRACHKMVGEALPLNALLDELISSPFTPQIMVGIQLKKQHNLPGWRKDAENLTSSSTSLLKHFAKEILAT